MKVIVDNKIPYIREAIEQIADEVIYTPGKDFTPELVQDADALIIRTRTRCDRSLLAGSKVKFIATATIGFDHIDTAYCREAGITWTNAPGCNSASVAQYIQSALFILQQTRGMKLNQMTIGIVGVGNVGSKVADVARKLGIQVMLNDLPREPEGKRKCPLRRGIRLRFPFHSSKRGKFGGGNRRVHATAREFPCLRAWLHQFQPRKSIRNY